MSDTGCIGTPEHAAHRGQEARARHYEKRSTPRLRRQCKLHRRRHKRGLIQSIGGLNLSELSRAGHA